MSHQQQAHRGQDPSPPRRLKRGPTLRSPCHYAHWPTAPSCRPTIAPRSEQTSPRGRPSAGGQYPKTQQIFRSCRDPRGITLVAPLYGKGFAGAFSWLWSRAVTAVAAAPPVLVGAAARWLAAPRAYGPVPPPSRALRGRDATALRAAVDRGASTGPGQRDRGQAGACPRRGAAPITGCVLVDLVAVEQLAVDRLGPIVGGGGSGL